MMCKKCKKCNNEMIFEDDSFTHEFGIEINKYYYCENCDYAENEEGEEV